jgi:CheY-like chemotaxis protein
MYPPAPRIAIVNSNQAILETVTLLLEEEGYHAIPVLAQTFSTEEEGFSQFMAEHTPQVVLWDIGPPYDVNWQRFQQIKSLPQMQECPYILTTTDIKRLEEITGAAGEALEIVGKPFDLEKMLNAIEKALAARG